MAKDKNVINVVKILLAIVLHNVTGSLFRMVEKYYDVTNTGPQLVEPQLREERISRA